METIGTRIRRLRKALGMDRQAQRSGIDCPAKVYQLSEKRPLIKGKP